ncbi:MAG: PQQ-binding-like beta-propeller repeat protein [Lachnospiraceae bacterium]|nr:PQQ-binding-like beta-propeller repeat protein [Lachnospiraceae bacterium]
MKKGTIYVLAALSSFMLASCTLTGTDEVPELYQSNVVADPVKSANTDDPGSTNDTKPDTDINVTDPGNDDNGGQDIKTNNELPSSFEVERENTENASFYEHLKALDEKGNVIWQFDTDEIMVGQYDSTADVGLRDNGYYYIADYVLYCLDPYTGEVIWQADTGLGAYDFDEDGNFYSTGYEGPSLRVIDPNGNTLHNYGLKDSDGDLSLFYWAYDLDYEDGLVYITCESMPKLLVVDPETGDAWAEVFGGNADWNDLDDIDWKMTAWECSDGRSSQTDGGSFEIEFMEGNYVSVKYTDSDGDVQDFDYMSIIFRPIDLYDGVRDDYYGVWTGECAEWNDPYNSFAFQMTDPDTLEMIWFTYDDDGNPGDYYTIIRFFNAELAQYYQDKLNSNK